MNYSKLFTTIGLALSLFGALVLVVPNLIMTRNVNDDYIVSMDQKTGNYTQKKHLTEQKINSVGFILLSLGFCFQIIGLFEQN